VRADDPPMSGPFTLGLFASVSGTLALVSSPASASPGQLEGLWVLATEHVHNDTFSDALYSIGQQMDMLVQQQLSGAPSARFWVLSQKSPFSALPPPRGTRPTSNASGCRALQASRR
jgi:hypothetical protein